MSEVRAPAADWVCPRCHGALGASSESLECGSCSQLYPLIGGALGIPDFRMPELERGDLEADRERARELLAHSEGRSSGDIVRRIFSARPHWSEAQIERRTREVLAAPARLEGQLRGWLQASLDTASPLLDIGCGQGGLLCAAAERSASPVGIDTSLAWLIVAGMALRERGFPARLAAAHAEALPLADGWAGAVVSLDVIEHVSSPEQMLGEVDRVIRPGGVFLFSTPNRYSLGAEPHVGVWGVGWLPRGWQAPYVKWRRGDAYAGTQLLSGAEIARLVRSNTSLELSLDTPSIPEADIAVFKPYRVLLARIYNRLAAMPVLRPLWLRFAPFYRATCTKR